MLLLTYSIHPILSLSPSLPAFVCDRLVRLRVEGDSRLLNATSVQVVVLCCFGCCCQSSKSQATIGKKKKMQKEDEAAAVKKK